MVAAFKRMLRGRAQVVSLIGEAGVGKSRLLQGALRPPGRPAAGVRDGAPRPLLLPDRAAVRRLRELLPGEGYGVAAGDSLEVARQALGEGLTALGGAADETASIASLFGYVLGLEAPDRFRHVEPEQLKRQISWRSAGSSSGGSSTVPWCSWWRTSSGPTASVELLQGLIDRLADQPLMLVATYRPSFELRGLATTRATHTALRLMPLSPAESEAC